MSGNHDKVKELKNLNPKQYRIYGIFNFKTKELVYVELDLEKAMFEFDLEGYNLDEYDLVFFDVLID